MKPTVLIVDDEKVICEGLARLLAENYITYKAFNGREAIDLLRKHGDIDVILCDLKMPEMDGNRMIEKIRSENKDVNIIVISAASPLMVCDALRKGANNFMRKPLNIDQLERTIKNAVKKISSRIAVCNH